MHDAFRDLHADTRDALGDLAGQWADGLLSARSFADAMDEVLIVAHTEAVVIGRTHAGDSAPKEADDRRFAETVVEGEHDFLQAFREQMEAGRYTDEAGLRDGAEVARRARLYGDRITGTANDAWTLALDPETLLVWKLGGSAESACSDCPEIAARSPFTIADAATLPGKNETLCGARCRCIVSLANGQRGFVTP